MERERVLIQSVQLIGFALSANIAQSIDLCSAADVLPSGSPSPSAIPLIVPISLPSPQTSPSPAVSSPYSSPIPTSTPTPAACPTPSPMISPSPSLIPIPSATPSGLPSPSASPSCVRGIPTVQIGPSSDTAVAGGSARFYVSVTNTDSPGCGTTTLTQSLGLSPWSAIGIKVDPEQLSISAGASGNSVLNVTVPPQVAGGTYTISNIVENQAAPGKMAKASVNLKVMATTSPSPSPSGSPSPSPQPSSSPSPEPSPGPSASPSPAPSPLPSAAPSASACVRAQPSVSFSQPRQIATQAGNKLYYMLWVTNKDDPACGTSQFKLRWNGEFGLIGKLEVSDLTLSPGQSDTALIQVSSLRSIEQRPYAVSVSISHSSSVQNSTTAQGSYVLNSNPLSQCTRVNPDLVLANEKMVTSQSGQALTYTVFVSNLDSPGCGNSVFKFSSAAPVGLTSYLDISRLEIRPGDSKIVKVQVTAPPGFARGSYSVSVSAQNDSDPNVGGTAVGSYVIDPSAPSLPSLPTLQIQYKPYAMELFNLLDSDSPEYKEMKKWVDQRDYVQALKFYRDAVVLRFRAADLGQFTAMDRELEPSELRGADMLVGYLTYDQYLDHSLSNFGGFKDYFGMRGAPQAIQWFPPAQGPREDPTTWYCDFSLLAQLPQRFLQTRDLVYLKKWIQIFSDFSQNQKKSMKNVPLSQLTPLQCNWGDDSVRTQAIVNRIRNTLRSFGALVKLLPGESRPSTLVDVLRPQGGALPRESLDLIPEIDVYHMVRSWVLEHPGILLKLYAPKGYAVSNRSPALLALGMLFQMTPEFQWTKSLYPLYLGESDRVNGPDKGGISGSIYSSQYPDGSFLERSFSYMLSIGSQAKHFLRIYDPKPPEWVNYWKNQLTEAQRSFAALITPFQGLPRVGEYLEPVPPPIWKDKSLWNPWNSAHLDREKIGKTIRFCQNTLLDCFGAPNSLPSFTSVALPFSGYAALRKNWGSQSPYLFMTTGLPSHGHFTADTNSIQVAAYGRQLLTTGGATFGDSKATPEMNEYLNGTNTLKTNSLIVNGQPQFRYGIPEDADSLLTSASRVPLPARWVSTPYFDFTEGLHSWGYGPPSSLKNRENDFNHQRQVIFLRELEAWILVDQLIANRPGATGNFTQAWHFPPLINQSKQLIPGFENAQISIQSQDRIIQTQDQGGLPGPNLALYFFGSQRLQFSKHWGETQAKTLGSTTPRHAGWTSLGLWGPNVPAPEVWSEWSGSGNQQVVTLLIPNPAKNADRRSSDSSRKNQLHWSSKKDLSKDSRAGFTVSEANGSSVTFLSSLTGNTSLETPDLPGIGSIRVMGGTNTVPGGSISTSRGKTISAGNFLQGSALLVYYNPTARPAEVTGLILGATQVSLAGHTQTLTGDFIFKLTKDSSGNSTLNKVADIKVPTSFKWIQNPTGLTVPQWQP